MSSGSWTPRAPHPAAVGARNADPPIDRVVFQSRSVSVGAFRCPRWHPRFRDSGPTQNYIFVFPRRTVRLCHDGGAPFLADPSVVTLYNRGQRYWRSAVSAAGDDCEWFAVEHGVLLDAVRHFDPSVEDQPERPFRHSHAPCDPHTYLTQRRLFDRLQVGASHDALEVEETVIALLQAVLARVYEFWRPARISARATQRQREMVESVKALLSERLGEPLRLSDIAGSVGSSVFHLCRGFRAATGSTLHAYRNQLRLQSALERLAGEDGLTEVALDLGFSSHSHFSAAFRRLFGVTPSTVRRELDASEPP